MKNILILLMLLCTAISLAKDETSFTVADEISNATKAVTLLREQLREPDSLVVEHVYGALSHKPDKPMICILYRARNGFNGYERDIAEYRGGDRIDASTLGPQGFGSFGSHCESVK